MDEDLRDVHYLTGLTDGLLVARRAVQSVGEDPSCIDTLIFKLSEIKANLVYDMYIGPSDVLDSKLLELEKVAGKPLPQVTEVIRPNEPISSLRP